jgi:hypothetical protein
MAVVEAERRDTWGVTATDVLRRLAAVTWAGALLGLLVGGVGGRLAMMLLARLNPTTTGMLTDDGFTIGRLTPATFGLLVFASLLGVVGGGVYFVLRGLMIGPRWFQVLAVSAGAAVVMGGQIVHVGGVDFTFLDPVWLAVALFVAIPGVYAALLTVLAERWLAPDGRFATSAFWLAVVPLLLWAPALPVLGVLLAGLLGFEAARRTRLGEAVLRHPASPWAARAGLAVVFTVALVGLVGEASALV